MNNVVNLFPNKKDPAKEFVFNALIPWAESNSIDTSSDMFKHSAAAIMANMQGMLCS